MSYPVDALGQHPRILPAGSAGLCHLDSSSNPGLGNRSFEDREEKNLRWDWNSPMYSSSSGLLAELLPGVTVQVEEPCSSHTIGGGVCPN